MACRYKFSETEIQEIEKLRAKNKDKRVEARLKALELRAKGASLQEVANATGYKSATISWLVQKYRDNGILMCCDGAAWHKSGTLHIPENIVLFHIPPYTPEMNPIEQIWKEIRKRGIRNKVFATLEKVMDRLCDTICSLSKQAISSITGRKWIIDIFN